MGSFVRSVANVLRRSHSLAGTVFGGLAFAGLTALIKYLGTPWDSTVLWGIVCAIPILFIPLAFLLGSRVVSLLNDNLSALSKDMAMRAAIGLSYLKPPNYVTKMKSALSGNPKRLLKQHILLGLGYCRRAGVSDILLKEFHSNPEEIQLAILEALKNEGSFDATRFTLDVVLSNTQALTPRVRLNAAKIVVALYGKSGIPILMLGISDKDPRQLANVLEALATFREPELKNVFKCHVSSLIPRVRANALLGLYYYKSERELYRAEVLKTLDTNSQVDTAEVASILYVLGKNRDLSFRSEIKRLFVLNNQMLNRRTPISEDSMSMLQTLAWVMIRFQEAEGYGFLLRLLEESYQGAKWKAVVHFFLQLDDHEKFDCIEEWLKDSSDRDKTYKMLVEIFQNSGMDFHEEIAFIESIVDSNYRDLAV
jgi:hypothetical protein